MSSSYQTISDFVRSNVEFEFKNLALVTPKEALAVATEQNNNDDDSSSSELIKKQQNHRDAAFQRIFYIYIQSDDVLPKLKTKLQSAFFPNDSNDSHKVMLSFDAEWYQPKGAHFTDWSQTKISLLQIGLKCYPKRGNFFSSSQQQQASNDSSSASTIKDDECSLVLVFDIFAGKNLSPSSPSLRSFLAWLFKVTASQPRLGFDVRCDAKVLNALGINLEFQQQNQDQNTTKTMDKIIDLQLTELLANARPISQRKGYPPFCCMVPGMAKLLRTFPSLAWLADLKQALKIRDNQQKMTLDHFLHRPIDIETMVYTVADAGMLFDLFEEMYKAYFLHFNNPTFVFSLLLGGYRYANLPRTGVEPKYDDNAFLPLGILDRIDNGFCGTTFCSKCQRNVARKDQQRCIICDHIMLRWKERD